MVRMLFKGYNVTILAYGQTGSGKTHSMGTCYDGAGDMGVIPRAVFDIFEDMEKATDYEFNVSVSFMELYQESLYDLLSNKPREQCVVDIRQDSKGIKIPGLVELTVMNPEDTKKCLMDGSAGRATGATAMNAQSSRSHAIFTVTVYMQKKNDTNSATTSKLHLVEGVNINPGLLALGNVISALGEESQKGYISYRDSKLTRLLQANTNFLMVSNIPCMDHLERTSVPDTVNMSQFNLTTMSKQKEPQKENKASDLVDEIEQRQPVYEEPFTVETNNKAQPASSSPLSKKGLTLR